MKTSWTHGWVGLLALVLAAPLGAQTLGEVAKKEQERREKVRQKQGGPTKVITEADLRGAGSGTVSNPGATDPASPAAPAASGEAQGEAGAAAQPAAAREKTDDEVRAEQEADWRRRLQEARDLAGQLTERVDRLQRSLNDLSAPLYGATRTTMLEQWETAKKDLAAAQQRVSELEEEGRRKSYR